MRLVNTQQNQPLKGLRELATLCRDATATLGTRFGRAATSTPSPLGRATCEVPPGGASEPLIEWCVEYGVAGGRRLVVVEEEVRW